LKLVDQTDIGRQAMLLELGSGSNNAFHMQSRFAEVVLTDLSTDMLSVSEGINPDCTHVLSDMRSVKLDCEFDVAFVHDVIDYMLTPQDLCVVLARMYRHCKPGGLVLLVADATRESWDPRLTMLAATLVTGPCVVSGGVIIPIRRTHRPVSSMYSSAGWAPRRLNYSMKNMSVACFHGLSGWMGWQRRSLWERTSPTTPTDDNGRERFLGSRSRMFTNSPG